MKVLVTGGSGFVGSFLVDALIASKVEVIIFDCHEPRWGKYHDVEFIHGDITNSLQVKKAIQGADMVVHLAGLLGTNELVSNVTRSVEINIGGSVNVCEACIKYGVKLIAISKPNCWINPYTITKIAMEGFVEMYRREMGLEAVIVKWFNVYAGRQLLFQDVGYKKAVPTWIVSALANEPIEIYGNGNQTMDLIYATDAVSAVLKIMTNWNECEGVIFEVGSGIETSANDLAKIIKEQTVNCSEIVHVPMRAGEWEDTKIVADIAKMQKHANWSPTVNLVNGIKQTIAWYKEYYKQF